MKISKTTISFLAGIAFFLLLLSNPFGFSIGQAKILAVAGLMITWWITEALPMPVVALLPMVLFPLMGIAKLDATTAPYANPIVFLFMGGFIIGLAIEKWNLHKRIALNIVNLTGTSGNRIILGFILASGFLSMWLSNTATTMMMFPIALSVIQVVEEHHTNEKGMRNIAICLMLSIAYASNFGGIATIIGTPPNVAYVAHLSKQYNYTFQFIDWILICAPLSLLLLLSLYIAMTRFLFPNHLKKDNETAATIKHKLKELGRISIPEKRVLLVFGLTAFLWITKDIWNKYQGFLKLDDTIIAMLGAILLFIIPNGAKEKTGIQLLEWSDTKKMAWGILLLFGGGITLANQLEKAGLIQQLGSWIAGTAGTNIFVLILITTIVSVFVSEAMSNIAQVIVFAPVVSSIATALHINPVILGLPMTLAASCASMLPMGTPPNAIVFASGKLTLKDMLKTGLIMNIVSIILITLFSFYLVPLIIKGIL